MIDSSWLGCQVLPTIAAVSILELAANSGSSRMSQAPNLRRAMQLFIIIITITIVNTIIVIILLLSSTLCIA